jgi:hypothetical protein
MAAKLGSDDVSFRLGAGEVAAVYLGSQEVWSAVPEPATLYFNGVDADWTTVGNWWLDDEHTVAAGRLPTEIDSVVASLSVRASGQTVVDFTISGIASLSSGSLTVGSLTVTGTATFNDLSQIDQMTLNGNAVFNNDSSNNGNVIGTATFNNSSFNSGGSGTVTGNATFNDSARNEGSVTGTATFTGSACNSGGTAGTFVPDPPPSC